MSDDAAPVPAPKKFSVPAFTFTIPDGMRRPKDPKSLTVGELTLEQEEDAHRASKAGVGLSLTNELVKRSVVAVDGRPVDWSGDGPEWYDRASPKVRELAVRAFAKVNRTTDAEDQAFLDSAVATSG